jgi:NitT/TauT family transport system substrate-binding protein
LIIESGDAMPDHRHGTARQLVAMGLTAGAVLALAACGGGDEGAAAEEAAAGSPPAQVAVDVGIIPVSDVAVLYLGQEQGFFEERGITLEFTLGQGGAALVPSVVTGEYAFAFSNVISVMQAREQGLPLTIIAPAASSTGREGAGINNVMAIDPAIQDAGDLVGRTVAVNTLNNLLETLASASVKAAGGDPNAVNYVEMGFPDQLSALQSGDVDAFVCAEPFCSMAADLGAHVVADPFYDLAPDEQIAAAAYFTTEQQIAEDPQLFRDLQAAIHDSLEYAAAHPDEVRAQLPEYTQLDPALIERMTLSQFTPGLRPEELEGLAEAALEFGVLGEEPELDEVVWVPED